MKNAISRGVSPYVVAPRRAPSERRCAAPGGDARRFSTTSRFQLPARTSQRLPSVLGAARCSFAVRAQRSLASAVSESDVEVDKRIPGASCENIAPAQSVFRVGPGDTKA